MTEEIPFLSAPLNIGEMIRQRLLALGLFHTDFKIIAEQDLLFFPLSRSIIISDVFPDILTFQLNTGKRVFPEAFDGPKTLSDAFRGKLNDEEIDLLPRAYDLIGDIAVLEIPEELADHRYEIGSEFLKIRPNFVTVLGKTSAISGTLRIRDYELLAGVDKTDTIHTEYGIRIAVDLAKAYFSPRLLEEHHRIAEQVIDNERVIDMFSGVGPFALHIAKQTSATIISVDINSDATMLLKQSMSLNRLKGTIVPVTSDIREYVPSVEPRSIDRVIMNHPSGAFNFIDEACHLLRSGGIMHYYDFMGGDDPEEVMLSKVRHLIDTAGRTLDEVCLIRRVRDSAPYEYHMVLDAIIG